jgi:hypothetical protein
VPIEEIVIGQRVLEYDHDTGQVAEGRVERVWVHPDRTFAMLALPAGRALDVTDDHPIYAVNRERYIAADALAADAAR